MNENQAPRDKITVTIYRTAPHSVQTLSLQNRSRLAKVPLFTLKYPRFYNVSLTSPVLTPITSTTPFKNYTLAYRRREAVNTDLPEIVFLSGFRSDMMGNKATFLDAYAEKTGQGFTRFDYMGHGESGGSFLDGTIGEWLSNTLHIIDTITRGKLILVGSSMGGWIMTLAALARPERVHALIGIAAAPDFTTELLLARFSPQQVDEFKRQGIAHVPSSENPSDPIAWHLIEESTAHMVLDKHHLPIACPVHFLHGLDDRDVPWQMSERLMKKITATDASLTLIKGGDHRLSTDSDLRRLETLITEMSGV